MVQHALAVLLIFENCNLFLVNTFISADLISV